jgi:hypothetical protein
MPAGCLLIWKEPYLHFIWSTGAGEAFAADCSDFNWAAILADSEERVRLSRRHNSRTRSTKSSYYIPLLSSHADGPMKLDFIVRVPSVHSISP